MSPEDADYYSQRAIVERHRARTAPDEAIARIHEQLAEHYEELVQGKSRRSTLRVVYPEQSKAG